MIAFGECKYNCDLWLYRVGLPVHICMLKKCTFLKFLYGQQNGHPAQFLQGHVMAKELVPLLLAVTKTFDKLDI